VTDRPDSSTTITAENTPLEFPCEFPIKAMVRSSERARIEVLDVVAGHVSFDPERDVRRRASRNGRFESVTISVRVESRQQLERIYIDVRKLDAVVMML
jgi:putative lipoic acid-binding regulatory protein